MSSIDSEPSVLTESESDRVLYEWNRTDTAYPYDKCIHELFEAQVEKTPDAVALTHGEISLSYGELNRCANRLARHIRGLGVGIGDSVATLLEGSIELVVADLAILKCGAAYVPVDPEYPADRKTLLLADSNARLILLGKHVQAPELSVIKRVEISAAISAEAPGGNLGIAHDSQGLAYVMYTSGSTGRPKGVMVTHQNVVRLVQKTNYVDFSRALVMAQVSNVAFDASTFEIWGPLLNGARLMIVARSDVLAPKQLSVQLTRFGVTTMFLTTALFNECVRSEPVVFRGMDQVLFGGEAADPECVRRGIRGQPPREFVHVYGPTETTTFATYFEINIEPGNTLPIGRPIANTRIYILDQRLRPVPVGVPGEIHIAGPGVSRGYFRRPDLTAERFITDAHGSSSARMYKTGDLGKWQDDGNIIFLGRNDRQVKIRGFRIELGEIEASLAGHQGVEAALVVAREDRPGDKRLVAYYIGSGHGRVTAELLQSYLSSRLPAYMVPAAFVRVQSFPLTRNGKVDRQALPAPDGDAYVLNRYEAPQGETETALARIWAELLNVPCVGRRDNFFLLGGHSLLAMRVITRVQQMLGLEACMRDLFMHPVLTDFSRHLSCAAHVELPQITRCQRGTLLPLSFAQQRLWFLSQMEGVSKTYHIVYGFRLKGPLNVVALRQALDRIVTRHEALRTVFVSIDGVPHQRVLSAASSGFRLVEHDLRRHTELQTELDRLVAEEVAKPFDLEHGPVVRSHLICETEEQHVLLIATHHIASDGWSMDLFMKELSVLYAAFGTGQDDPLPEFELQYADYAVWQRTWMAGSILQQQAEYWKSSLAGYSTALDVPADHPRPVRQNYVGGWVPLHLDDELTGKLKQLSIRHGATLFMTLLAAWAALLSRLSGQRDIVVGTPTANRGRSEIEGLIGFFVNTLALRLDFSGSPTVADLLEQAKSQTLASQQHQDIPFERVVELVRPARGLTQSPLFHVMFAWENFEQHALDLHGLSIQRLQCDHGVTANFDLTLSLRALGTTVAGGVEYARSLFERSTIERYIGYLRTLFEGMVADEIRRVDSIPLFTPVERDQILFAWNDTAADFPHDQCVHGLFEAHASRAPHALAVAYESQELTYAELNRCANRLAHYLRGLGVQPDSRIAICVERGLHAIVGVLGVLKSEAAYVPLDPACPVERLSHMLADSGARVLLTQGHLKKLFVNFSGSILILDASAPELAWRDQPETNPDRAALTPSHLAYVMYTSGSTGAPKAVLVEHRGLCNQVAALKLRYHLTPNDRILQFASLSFDMSVEEIFGALCSGTALVLRTEEWLGSPGDFRNCCDRNMVTVANLPTAFWRQLLLSEEGAGMAAKSLRQVMIGGEAVTDDGLRAWFQGDRWRPALFNAYGPTEATVNAAIHEVMSPLSGHKCIGRPVANTSVYILDEQYQPVPVGVVGELYIAGVGVARGYLNRPDLTVERFLADPFNTRDGARMYKTGDLCRWRTDGTVEFLGRNDFQIKVRGFRIEAGEIEAQLLQCDGVREAVVVSREVGPGDLCLVGYYTTASAGEESTPVLTAEHCEANCCGCCPRTWFPPRTCGCSLCRSCRTVN